MEGLKDCQGSGGEADQQKVCGHFQGLPEADTSFLLLFLLFYCPYYCINVIVCLYAIIVNVTMLLAQSGGVSKVHIGEVCGTCNPSFLPPP